MITSRFLLLFLLASGIAAARDPQQGPPPDPIARTLDRDHNHEISSREMRRAPKALLKLDEDRDGALSREELHPAPPEERRGRADDEDGDSEDRPKPPRSPLMGALDLNADGSLSAEEIEAAEESLATLDTDGDGSITREDLGPPPSGPPSERGSGGPPPGRRPGGPPPGGR